ncbi:hypothetical protein Bca4012_037107 [Brassica carinata]
MLGFPTKSAVFSWWWPPVVSLPPVVSPRSLYPSPPLSCRLLPLCSPANILTVVASLSSPASLPGELSSSSMLNQSWRADDAGCCSRPWTLIPVAASSLVDVAGFHPFVFPNKSVFRLKLGCRWIQWGWLFAVFDGWSFDRLWFLGSPPRCGPIILYCDLRVLMVSLHLQVVELCGKANFWRRVPGQAINTGSFSYVYWCLSLKLLILCCALQRNPSNASQVVLSLALGFNLKLCFPYCILLL